MFAERNRPHNLISFALDSNYDATFKIGMINCLYMPTVFVFFTVLQNVVSLYCWDTDRYVVILETAEIPSDMGASLVSWCDGKMQKGGNKRSIVASLSVKVAPPLYSVHTLV